MDDSASDLKSDQSDQDRLGQIQIPYVRVETGKQPTNQQPIVPREQWMLSQVSFFQDVRNIVQLPKSHNIFLENSKEVNNRTSKTKLSIDWKTLKADFNKYKSCWGHAPTLLGLTTADTQSLVSSSAINEFPLQRL